MQFSRSYLVLTAGFFFAPQRVGDNSDDSFLGPVVSVRSLSESVRLFWAPAAP